MSFLVLLLFEFTVQTFFFSSTLSLSAKKIEAKNYESEVIKKDKVQIKNGIEKMYLPKQKIRISANKTNSEY